MIVEKLGELLALVQLQRALSQVGTANIVSAILVGALVVLIVDYARMLYLHFKMVRCEELKKK